MDDLTVPHDAELVQLELSRGEPKIIVPRTVGAQLELHEPVRTVVALIAVHRRGCGAGPAGELANSRPANYRSADLQTTVQPDPELPFSRRPNLHSAAGRTYHPTCPGLLLPSRATSRPVFGKRFATARQS